MAATNCLDLYSPKLIFAAPWRPYHSNLPLQGEQIYMIKVTDGPNFTTVGDTCF